MLTNLLVVTEQQLQWKTEQETYFRVVDVSQNCVIDSALDFHATHSKRDASVFIMNKTKKGNAFRVSQMFWKK